MEPITFLAVLLALLQSPVTAGPQTNLLNRGCSQYNASNPSSFVADLNATFSGLRSNLSASHSAVFATASRPVYALFQCRDYLSSSDCLACFSTAAALLLSSCAPANGARVIYDGCMLRYESAAFFDQGSLIGNVGLCGNRTNRTAGFAADVDGLMMDLSVATPRISGYFAAAVRDGVYGVAQCVESVTEETCGSCLAVAYGNINGCPPNAEARAVDAGCFMRYSDEAFFPTNQTVDLAPFLNSGSSSKTGAIIGGVVGGVGVLLLLALAILLWIKKFRKSPNRRKGNILGATELQGPKNFRYRDLKAATENFNDKNKLGEGGFGDVYKGTLKNGTIVAVKRLAITKASRVQASFQSEVKLISNVHHRNLVRLLGCSSKGLELLLVYEYMANSSLDKFLFGANRGTLNWKQRFDIIVGMARGLAYLHQEFHVCIIHRDIKSSNILLDDNFQAKIADFGLARLLPSDQSHLSTKFAGTLGYTAPEYAIHGQLSEKVDTYGFGVVVLEIISGRKSNDMHLEPLTQYLLEWVNFFYNLSF
ncbi:Non-specific serine/threonine protein kinase protein [Dioscorea alata]|uniref:Non-specific serine/threonine protein kinase protein n=1 Tax=Dioscorea alata TaxID=55571 RepID=A0ACB7TZE7_DIOAL|nr:Non-specific serine/threonine protein kinase protein [Dioscorea alata]